MVSGKLGREIAFHQNVLDSQLIATQRQGTLDDFVQVHARALGFIFAREVQEILDDPPRPPRFLKDFIRLGQLGRRKSVTQQQLSVPNDRRQRIVQFVRDVGHQLAHRRHFFRLQKLRLNLALSGHIAVKLSASRSRALPLAERDAQSVPKLGGSGASFRVRHAWDHPDQRRTLAMVRRSSQGCEIVARSGFGDPRPFLAIAPAGDPFQSTG